MKLDTMQHNKNLLTKIRCMNQMTDILAFISGLWVELIS